MTRAPIRVFLVDDHRLFLSGVRSELGEDFEIVGDADDVASAVAGIREPAPTWWSSTSTCPTAADRR